jgi:hypothetical protein
LYIYTKNFRIFISNRYQNLPSLVDSSLVFVVLELPSFSSPSFYVQMAFQRYNIRDCILHLYNNEWSTIREKEREREGERERHVNKEACITHALHDFGSRQSSLELVTMQYGG